MTKLVVGAAIRAMALASLALAAILMTPLAERALAQTNISGSWNLTLQHPDAGGPIACAMRISQNGTLLSSTMTCTGLGSGSQSGSINKMTQAFTLSGPIADFTMNMSGTAAGDGNSMSGTFTLPPIPSNGTFSGFRKSGPVGGIAELAGVNVAPLRSDGSSGQPVWLLGAGVVLVALALGGAAWYARRRRTW